MAGDAEADAAASGGQPQAMEPLACVTCRARKLKCDRVKPACARCVKVNNECVYPEARRKPTFKRRNVKELEARLAQVEVFLKEVSKHDQDEHDQDGHDEGKHDRDDQDGHGEDNANSSAPSMDTGSRTAEYDFATDHSGQSRPSQGHTETPMELPDLMPEDGSDNVFEDAQLMNLGLTEALPPFEIMEELNILYFNHHHANLPIVHPGRFWQAFYGSPLRKPPMSLQYAIWAIAARFHPKYDKYSEVFYTRARQYADGDEMKGAGEHFITIAHAQTYALIATYEANCMLFTRASITGAKSVRLAQMMGLDRLDCDQDGIPPALGPVTSWVEMEERRRTFWGAFVMDAHASISTGWSSLINTPDVVTRLPAPDSAFLSGTEEQSCFLEEAFKGGQYSGFASTVVVCRILKAIIHHVNRPKPYDRPEDLMNGPFWVRHRELDNELSSAFMFLPENLSLPRNIRDPTALFTNLNLHAAVICLHHAAIEKAEENGHADTIKRTSVSRLKATAEEVCNIIKLISHNAAEAFKSPLSALSLYCAFTVYIYLARDDPENSLDSIDRANLEILTSAMEASSRVNRITSVFLRQVWLDVESNGLEGKMHIPALKKYRDGYYPVCSNIPMIARHAVGRHSMIAPVLPGRLPLDKPQGKLPPSSLRFPKTALPPPYNQTQQKTAAAFQPVLGPVTRNISCSDSRKEAAHCQKRKRMSPSPIPSGRVDLGVGGMSARDSTGIGMDFENQGGILGPEVLSSSGTKPQRTQPGSVALPDRAHSSSSSSSPLNRVSGYAETQSGSSHTSPGIFGLGNTAEENRVDLRPFQDRIATPIWQTSAEELFLAQISGSLVNNTFAGDGTDTWGILDEQLDWGNSSSAN